MGCRPYDRDPVNMRIAGGRAELLYLDPPIKPIVVALPGFDVARKHIRRDRVGNCIPPGRCCVP